MAYIWTNDDDTFCCRFFIENYILSKSYLSLTDAANLIHISKPQLLLSSIKMKLQNIKQICCDYGVSNNFYSSGLVNYSVQNLMCMLRQLTYYNIPTTKKNLETKQTSTKKEKELPVLRENLSLVNTKLFGCKVKHYAKYGVGTIISFFASTSNYFVKVRFDDNIVKDFIFNESFNKYFYVFDDVKDRYIYELLAAFNQT